MTGDVTLGPGWYDADTATLGDRITGAREAAGLSQTELARRLGVRLATIRAWEDDQADPRANKLQMLAGLLGVSIMWLLTGKGDGLDSPAQNAPLPDDLLAQLREGGRVVCLFAEGALGVVRVGHKMDGVVNWRFGFNAGAPVLDGFRRPVAFAL